MKSLQRFFKKSTAIVEKPENHFQKKVLNDLSSGETIEIDGKTFTKITIQIVDSMDYRVTNFVEKLECEIDLLKEEVEKIRIQNESLLSKNNSQFQYISLLLSEKEFLQNRLSKKNVLIVNLTRNFRVSFELLRKKYIVMWNDKNDELEQLQKKIKEKGVKSDLAINQILNEKDEKLKIFASTITHLERKSSEQKEELNRLQVLRQQSKKELEKELEKIEIANKIKMENLYAINSNLVEIINQHRKNKKYRI
jgi:hypothetical protein